MSKSTLVSSLVALVCVLLPLCAAQGSCRGRCGEPFVRGQICNCDYNCFVHGECCKDFEEVCTTGDSCRGRCGETFLRGKECNCDPDCVLYNTCCSDYHPQCDYTEQCMAACLASQNPDLMRDGAGALDRLNLMAASDGPALIGGAPVAQDPMPLTPSDLPGIPSSPSGFPLPEPGPVGGPSSGQPLPMPVQVSFSVIGQREGPSSSPAPGSGIPSTLEDIAQAIGTSPPSGLGIVALLNLCIPYNANSNPDICSSLPIDGLATLFNGTIIVFKSHHFWLLNPKTKSAGPARSITKELGVPSPIDTAFTRCNCQGKTYIIKGDDYWVFENGVMDPESPKSVSKGFGGLTGEITAALSIPATRKRPEIVYFFKKGGTAQKFAYPPGSGPTCSSRSRKNSIYSKLRRVRQAEIQLSGEININLSWKGFPTPVTSAMSIPNSRKADGFDYLVFSGPKIFNIRISGDLPTLPALASSSSQQNEIRSFLRCP
ncbi:Proteoglycan 4 [Triplophysa tibetana]|uniref:Proteoglycan 4 n=1 Tax=Triplophysa tibetana TaxID=1572043 RepID=A0A5A9PDQ0_9TELE|nr:Proteoglycan 4 [Triplophysa tibetana]